MASLIAPHPALPPSRTTCLSGSLVDIQPVNLDAHADKFWEEIKDCDLDALLYYMFIATFESKEAYMKWFQSLVDCKDRIYFSIIDRATQRVLGVFSYMEIVPDMGTIELGCVVYSPALQKSRQGTEAAFLMFQHAFDDLGYRRFEWKCDNNNAKSKDAALRYGFTFEGVFRQHKINKGRNRDTAWFSIIDSEWPQRKQAFLNWLDESNFVDNCQVKSLSKIREELTNSNE